MRDSVGKRAFLLSLLVFAWVSSSFGVEREELKKALKRRLIMPPAGKTKIFPHKRPFDPASLEALKVKIARYRPHELLKLFPRKITGGKLRVVPVEALTFLPSFDEYLPGWAGKKVKVIVLADGVWDLDLVCRILNQKSLLSRENQKTFTLKAPLLVGPRASLVIQDRVVRMALDPGAILVVLGNLYTYHSRFLSWDTHQQRSAPKLKLEEKEYYLWGTETRPSILISGKGSIISIGCTFQRLGFRGKELSLKSLGHSQNLISPRLLLWADSVSSRLEILPGKPRGIFVGNDFIENFMGLYTKEAEELVLLGNRFEKNLQYGFDPHDWSRNILVAYNLFEKTFHAHGVVFSRYVSGTVWRNLCLGNGGAGIMMDRNSQAVIAENISIGNRLGGVSILESDGNLIWGNLLVRNGSYGILVRNSLDTLIARNKILRNLGPGVEVSVINIAYQTYRKLHLDPYHLASSAWIEENVLENNLRGALKTSYGGAVALYRNRFSLEPRLFYGEVSPYTETILEKQGKEPVVIAGYGDSSWIKKDLPPVGDLLEEAEKNFLKKGVKEAGVALGWLRFSRGKPCGLERLVRAASRGDPFSLYFVGALLATSPEKTWQKEGLLALSEAYILGKGTAGEFLALLPLFREVSEKDIAQALSQALKRLSQGRLLDCSLLPSPYRAYCCAKISPDSLNLNLTPFLKNLYLRASSERELYSLLFQEFLKERERTFPREVENIKQIIQKRNQRLLRYFAWEEETLRSLAREKRILFEAKRREQKEEFVREAWEKELKDTAKEDFEKVKPFLEEFFRGFNAYRLEDMKVSVSSEVSRIKKEYFCGDIP